MQSKRDVHVGLCGAGLGGLMASIALRRAGCTVTILEAASELGEIGAGIQMTPNVSRFLLKYGVADIIGDDLVRPTDIRMRRSTDSRVIQYTLLHPKTTHELGFPWWAVHRAHLHAGLVEAARRHGVAICVSSRVRSFEQSRDGKVRVHTEKGETYTFDLLVGSDGIKSIIRTTLFPDAKPVALTKNAAYRAVIPYSTLFHSIPEARSLFTNSFDAWGGDGSYIIAYPISGGRDLNLVLEHHTAHAVTDVEDVSMDEVFAHYQDYDPLLQKVLRLIPSVRRWPLLQTSLHSWSNEEGNVVLMGDAAHSMVNHMAQGAATSMEDGVFLGRVMHEVVYGVLSIPEAVRVYEEARMPRAWVKQQVSFAMGAAYMYDEERGRARDESSMASVPEHLQPNATSVKDKQSSSTTSSAVPSTPDEPHTPTPSISPSHKLGPDVNHRSWNYWGAPDTVPSIWTYDAEGDADFHVLKYLQEKTPVDKHTSFSSGIEKKWTGWYLPPEQVGRIGRSRL